MCWFGWFATPGYPLLGHDGTDSLTLWPARLNAVQRRLSRLSCSTSHFRRNFNTAESYLSLVTEQTPAIRDTIRLHEDVDRLRRQLRDLKQLRDQAVRKRRRRLFSIGLALSIIVHIALLTYFGLLYRAGAGEQGEDGEQYEFALVFNEELTADEPQSDELAIDDALDVADVTPDDLDLTLDPVDPISELTAGGVGDLPALGGSGGGEEGLSGLGGSGGTSYFGIAATGQRFAYIIDRSGSMGVRNRMEIAMQELIRSIESLPDYAYFSIRMFSSGPLLEPPMQRGWTQARRSAVNQHVRWLEQVSPGGGTDPAPAFHQVFDMNPRPDVIFFMTDGIIVGFPAEEVAQLNSRGKRVVVNTIAFGDQGSEDLLRRIARESGGQYRYVPDRGQ